MSVIIEDPLLNFSYQQNNSNITKFESKKNEWKDWWTTNCVVDNLFYSFVTSTAYCKCYNKAPPIALKGFFLAI